MEPTTATRPEDTADGAAAASPLRPAGWRRLWQPRRGVFWLMVGFNVLSSLMAGVLRSEVLSPTGTAVVGMLALTNALAGMWLAVRLLRGE